ncbi:MAG: hypothetical protein KF819_35930 [Labilithrix sp.]|nr:hypothetical protein [Labilithrix sp.]
MRRILRAGAIGVLAIGATACAAVLGIDGDYYEVEEPPLPAVPTRDAELDREPESASDAGDAADDGG